MATWGSLLTDTERLLDDVANDRWAESVVYQYMDDTQLEFILLTEINRTPLSPGDLSSLTLPLTSGTALYELSTIIGPVLRVEDAAGSVVSETTEELLDSVRPGWRSDRGAPKRYVRSKTNYGVITLYPKPDGAAVTASSPLKVFAAVRPTAISTDGTASGQSPSLPVHYHQAIPFGAAYRCLLWNQDTLALKLAEMYKNRFMEFVAQAKADTARMK